MHLFRCARYKTNITGRYWTCSDLSSMAKIYRPGIDAKAGEFHAAFDCGGNTCFDLITLMQDTSVQAIGQPNLLIRKTLCFTENQFLQVQTAHFLRQDQWLDSL